MNAKTIDKLVKVVTIVGSAAIVAGVSYKAYKDEKTRIAKEKKEKEEAEKRELEFKNHKKLALAEKNFGKDIRSASVENDGLSSEEKYQAYSYLRTLEEKIEHAQTNEAFDKALDEFDLAVLMLTVGTDEEHKFFLKYHKEYTEERKRAEAERKALAAEESKIKKEREFELQKVAQKSSFELDKVKTIAEAVKAANGLLSTVQITKDI